MGVAAAAMMAASSAILEVELAEAGEAAEAAVSGVRQARAAAPVLEYTQLILIFSCGACSFKWAMAVMVGMVAGAAAEALVELAGTAQGTKAHATLGAERKTMHQMELVAGMVELVATGAMVAAGLAGTALRCCYVAQPWPAWRRIQACTAQLGPGGPGDLRWHQWASRKTSTPSFQPASCTRFLPAHLHRRQAAHGLPLRPRV